MAALLSFGNPVFSYFAFHAGAVVMKTMAMSVVTALNRVTRNVRIYTYIYTSISFVHIYMYKYMCVPKIVVILKYSCTVVRCVSRL